MDVQEEPQLLKRGAQRSVWRALEQGQPAALKRWDGGGAWRSLRARASARREFELLQRLHALGFPVPRPIALRERAGRPELVSDWVAGVELRTALAQGAAPELARRLGRVLARAHRLGLRHADLHAGNVLVDERGEPWLVDGGGASLGAPLSPAERAEALVMVCADLREQTSRSWRARVLGAYQAELGQHGSPGEARAIEARAQERRRSVIAHAQRRWLRDSSSCVRLEDAQGARLQSRHGPEPDETRLELEPRSQAAARRLWLAAVRLCDHGLPSARPLAWFLQREERLVFGLPPLARECGLAEALAELEPQLADRGLVLLPGATLRAWRDPRGRPWLSGAERIGERAGRAPWPSR